MIFFQLNEGYTVENIKWKVLLKQKEIKDDKF